MSSNSPGPGGPEPDAGPPSDGSLPRRWRTMAWSAVVGLSIIIAILSDGLNVIGLLFGRTPDGPTSPQSTSPRTSPPPTSTMPPRRSWSDDFADGVIDPAKWRLEADTALIYERNDVLNFDVPDGRSNISNTNGQNPRITALSEGLLIKEFSFRLTFVSASQ